MNKPPLSPVNDYVFKRVFGEHLPILADFLQAVLDLPVTEKDIRVVNPTFTANTKGDKLSSLDVKVETKQYGVIDVEIQVEFYADLWKRFQYYTARMYVDQMRSGEDYTKLTKAISIIIADFSFFANDDAYHHKFRLFDKVNSVEYPDSIEINILEIPKRRGNSSKISHWLEFFASRTEEQFMQVSLNEPAMEEAWGVIKQLSADEQERLEAEAAEKARRDSVARIRYAEMKGLEQGRLEGREEGITEGRKEGLTEGKSKERLEWITNMLAEGLSIEQISKYSHLPFDEVESLAAQSQDNK